MSLPTEVNEMDIINEDLKVALDFCASDDDSKCDYCYYEERSWCQRDLARDVLEQIENLEAIIKDKEKSLCELEQKVPKWVSIKDRLPEHVRGNYLILLSGEIYAAKWEYDEWNEKYAFRINCQIVPNVTHWMKVPEPPEEENYDGLS